MGGRFFSASSPSLFSLAGSERAGAGGAHGHVHEVDVIPGDLVLVFIEVARDRTHHVLGNGCEGHTLLGNGFGGFKLDHILPPGMHKGLQTMAKPVSVAMPRPLRIQSSTGCSRM